MSSAPQQVQAHSAVFFVDQAPVFPSPAFTPPATTPVTGTPGPVTSGPTQPLPTANVAPGIGTLNRKNCFSYCNSVILISYSQW